MESQGPPPTAVRTCIMLHLFPDVPCSSTPIHTRLALGSPSGSPRVVGTRQALWLPMGRGKLLPIVTHMQREIAGETDRQEYRLQTTGLNTVTHWDAIPEGHSGRACSAACPTACCWCVQDSKRRQLSCLSPCHIGRPTCP